MKKLLALILLFPFVAFAQPAPGGLCRIWDGTDIALVSAGKALLVDGSATTQPVSGTVTVTDGSGALNTIVDSGSLTCNAGTNLNTSALATVAKQPALGTAGTASADVISVQGIASMTPLLVGDGTGAFNVIVDSGTITAVTAITNALPAGSNAIGKLAANSGVDIGDVTIDNTTLAVTQSGTWTVQPGNTANTTAWLTQNTPATTGGFTTYHLVSAATTNATVVKASAGQLYGWYIYNSNAAARKLAFHNTASTPTAGASIFFTIMLPAGSAANVFNDTGIPFSSGIAITTVTEIADSGTTAVAANDLILNLFYK